MNSPQNCSENILTVQAFAFGSTTVKILPVENTFIMLDQSTQIKKLEIYLTAAH